MFLVILILSTAFSATPNFSNCDYYLEKEKETACYVRSAEGTDYLINFGYRLCSLYLQKAAQWNDERTVFINKVAYCLQSELEKFSGTNICKQIEDQAFATHPKCYKLSGYCELSVAQKTSIIWTAIAADALQKGRPSLAHGLQLLKECNGSSMVTTVE